MRSRLLTRVFTLVAVPVLAFLAVTFLLLVLGQAAPALAGHDAAGSRQPADATFVVSGTVTDRATGRGISDVVVYAWNRHRGSGRGVDRTDGEGRYSVTLEAGSYDLNFTPPCGSGYASLSIKGIAGPPDVTRNVVLSPGHSVSGTVYAPDQSTPVSNTALYVSYRKTADGFGLPPTDASGRYCVGLVTGTCELSFAPPPCLGFGPENISVTIDRDIVTDVVLPAGFTLGGCVVDGSGALVPGVQVYAQEDPETGGYGLAPTDESGCFSGTLPLTGTPPAGTYDVQFIPPPYLGLGSTTVVDVVSETSGCPNTTLPVALPDGHTLSGRVTCNGEGIKDAFVHALPQGPQDPQNSLPGYGLSTVDDGSYALPLVSGTYRVDFTPPKSAGLHARAFTTTAILSDTVLNVDFCLCSGNWVIETVDGAGNVGGSTSLALAPTYPYTPQISYQAIATDGEFYLKYAWLSATTWLSETIISGGEATSLALVPGYPYTPCISHHHWWEWVLKYTCWDGTTWKTEKVAGQRSHDSSLAIEPVFPYAPHISYYNPWGTIRTLYHASATAWLSGTWAKRPVEPSGSRAGYNSSLALESTYPYTLHVSYYDGGNGDLRYARKAVDGWLTSTVDSGGDVGRDTSLVLDSKNMPHISYLDSTNYALKYAWLSENIWLSETVDSLGTRGRWGTSLELDGHDYPSIGYSSWGDTNGGLKWARFDGKVWITQIVDADAWLARSHPLVLDPAGCPHIAYYDPVNEDLKYAHIPAMPVQAGFVASPTAGMAPLTVIFSNTSSGGYVESLWDFGDGATSTEENPVHTYMAPGIYSVVLAVRGPGGLDTETEHIRAGYGAYLPVVLRP